MKSEIAQLVAQAVKGLSDLGKVSKDMIVIERTRDPQHGDFACNIAMRLAKTVGQNPRELAQQIIDQLPASDLVDSAEIAGPGFINFRINKNAAHQQIADILNEPDSVGRLEKKDGAPVLLEFVSANPTGPLHVGHGRLAAYGATLGNILEAAGYAVDREYYVNDAGRQMNILGASVWLRMLELQGVTVPFPEGGYRGAYISDLAAEIDANFVAGITAEQVQDGLPADGPEGDKETHIDALIARAKELVSDETFLIIRQHAVDSILGDIREDLEEFGVTFDRWYSEQTLTDNDKMSDALESLKEHDVLYEKDGAYWFRATDYGDEKDRVVIRDNGVTTYFASDIVYHADKRERGYNPLIDILGSDHHGYLARVRAGLQAMGFSDDCLEVRLVQFVSLYRGGVKQSMGTRSGNFVTLRQLREEVGNDAARFFYIMRSNDQHLDFDLELATSRSNDNPVYYIQYAHARICSVLRQLDEKGLAFDMANGLKNLQLLTEAHETALMTSLGRYSEVIALAASNRAPQHLAHYLRDLANDFHSYYNAHVFLVDDADLRDARIALIRAAQVVLADGLALLGVSAPESM